MIALLESYKAGLFRKEHWLNNIISGLIVGVVALPLAMAFAIASGVKPEQGIYTAIIAGFLTTVFGGSRLQISGPTGAFIVILSGITATYGVSGLQIATVMAGIMLAIMGLFRLGALMKFIPQSVILGFTAGIGVIIWVGQWKEFFGLKTNLAPDVHFHEKFLGLLESFPTLHIATTIIATISLLILIIAPRINLLKRIPGPLIVLILGTAAQAVFNFKDVSTIGSAFGGIPQSLQGFSFISGFSWQLVPVLMGPAFAIALLGAIESLLSATVADRMAGTKFNPNQELIGQGIANFVVPFFGGFAATGAIARTATNIRNGATSPLSGIIHCVTLLAIVLLLAPLAVNVPLAVLAAILFVVAWNMSELHHIAHVFKTAPRTDIIIMFVTFIFTVFVDLVVAVEVGVAMAALLFMRRMASNIDVHAENEIDTQAILLKEGITYVPGEVAVYRIEGPLFFASIESFEKAMQRFTHIPKTIVFNLAHVTYMDLTGISHLDDLIDFFHTKGSRVILTDINQKVQRRLERGGILKKLQI
jgi:SulP family sulfate permease